MQGVYVFIFLVCAHGALAQFLNHRPFPTYSLENMPETGFSCRDKILGGYYADAETECQMFHICVKVAGVGIQDFRFLCPNGTAFDQDHQICADWEDVDCDSTTLYYSSDNFDLYRIGSGFESKAVKYGEDEETFSLQRAETGDTRLNREHQSTSVNQQKEQKFAKKKIQTKGNNDRDIFKGSSSSNFFNNRNNGKENDDDYDDNVNVNQNNDNAQKKKLVRKQNVRRPVPNQEKGEEVQQRQQPRPQNNNRPNEDFQKQPRPQNNNRQNEESPKQQPRPQNNNRQNEDFQKQQPRPQNNNRQNEDFQKQQPRPQNNNKQNEDFQKQQPRPQNNNRQNEDFQKQQPRPQNNNRQNEDFQKQQPRLQNNRQNEEIQKQQARPQNNRQNEEFQKQQQEDIQKQPRLRVHNNNRQNEDFQRQEKPVDDIQKKPEAQTSRPNRPTGFVNNFAGSSYVPTTTRPASTTLNNEQYTTAVNNYRKRVRVNQGQQYNNAETFRQQHTNAPTPTYTVSTPAPFKQTQQYRQSTQYDDGQYRPTTPKASNEPENYPSNFPKTNTTPQKFTKTAEYQTQAPEHYDVPKVKATKQDVSTAGSFAHQFSKKATTPVKSVDTYPTTFAPKFKPSSTQFNNNYNGNSPFPSTFAPRTNSGYSQISQQTTQYKQSPAPQASSTPRTTPFTQYTPTVPKISSTTPVARSNRYDETQYDDGGFDGRKDDEFLKTAHSQNIASSRNELAKAAKTSTQRPQYESPRPFAVSSNTPRIEEKSTQQAPVAAKKVKNVSYDYAYYDTNVGSDAEYDNIDTEIKKSTAKN